MQAIKVEGVHIHVSATGPEDGPPVLLANSLGTDFRVWDAMIPHLPAGLRIIRYDKRGHGLSEAPPAPYGMDRLVADAAAVLEKANARLAAEEAKRKRLAAGELGLDIYDMRPRLAEKGLKYV